ncbi:NAD(P)H-dependent flavin oxidoreductase [Tumebacillus permanentifrigoris]|uniref:Probable nitronate monooxygenase n=1 Tax=Tumebacillus permanentifrigoris TaxID=378543 RepID=A0A316D2D1_9BACL|nr:nitronate monooxygenase [Tumebacillus permanentifrigoris]PWK03938.1 nitronate monooxygenase [Tumebacillus permanentifrigoris]
MKWSQTRVTETLGIEYPIIQAGMAGGATTPELVAAVSNAGGLGTLGAGYMTPDQIRVAIREIRTLTSRPFAVNLLLTDPVTVDQQQIARIQEKLNPIRRELGLPEWTAQTAPTQFAESFDAQVAVLLEELVPVLSFTFGMLSDEWVAACKERRIHLMGTATNVREALLLEQSGIDSIVGQGSEAGGHRGTFTGEWRDSLIGTMALIPQLVDAVQIPVIAAGGIMDGRGVAAARMLGAAAVQLGTAFLTCNESGAHPQYQQALLDSTEQQTTLIRAFSGKPARGLTNRFHEHLDPDAELLPPYPIQNALTRDIRQAAARQNRTEFLSMWAGQGTRLSRQGSAGELIQQIVEQVEHLYL